MGETAALLNESFAQARTVRAYRLEASETKRAEAAFQHLYRALLGMTRNRARVDPVLEVLGGAAVAAVIGFAGWRAAVGDGSSVGNEVGNFTGFVAALLIAARPLRALGSLNAAVQEGLAGLARVFRLIDETPAHPRARRRAEAARRRRARRVRRGALRLSGRASRRGRAELRCRARHDRRAGRPVGRRQVDGADVDPPSARRVVRRGDDRRRRRARRDASPACATPSPMSARTRCCSTTRSRPTSAWGGPARPRTK